MSVGIDKLREKPRPGCSRGSDTRTRFTPTLIEACPWVCGELTVHHHNHNHSDNPLDGGNWELSCVCCHDNEHSRQSDYAGVSALAAGDKTPAATSNSFAGLKSLPGKGPLSDG